MILDTKGWNEGEHVSISYQKYFVLGSKLGLIER